jgi:hypothetical protein
MCPRGGKIDVKISNKHIAESTQRNFEDLDGPTTPLICGLMQNSTVSEELLTEEWWRRCGDDDAEGEKPPSPQ